MNVRVLKQESGFTLVEILVATAIAAIGFLGLAATHVSAVRATALGRHVSLATGMASQQIETMRRLPYDQVVSSSPSSTMLDHMSFTGTPTVTAAPGGNSKKVTMNVGWNDQFGSHTVQLITVIGK